MCTVSDEVKLDVQAGNVIVRFPTMQLIAIAGMAASVIAGVWVTTDRLGFRVDALGVEIALLRGTLDEHTKSAESKLHDLEREIDRGILPETNRRMTALESWRGTIEIRLGKLEAQR